MCFHTSTQAITVSGQVTTTDGSSPAGFRMVVEQVGGELPHFIATTAANGTWSVSDPLLFGNIRITASKTGYQMTPAQIDRFTSVNIADGNFTAAPLVPDIALRTAAGGVLSSGASVVLPSDFPGTAVSVTLLVRNNGTVPLTGIAYSFSGPQAAEFSLGGPTLATLPAGGEEAISLRVVPAAEGLRSAVLSIASNDPDQNPFTLALSATALPLSLLEVSTTADSGAGSLRAAAAQAAASSAAQSLTFAPALDGQIIRLDTQIAIPGSVSLTIDARTLPGGLTVRDNGGTNRAFLINANATLTLGGLTLSGQGNGEDRGGILRNHGTLALKNCTLTGGRVPSPQTTVGGAIYNAGSLQADHCSFTGNIASLGGCLYNDTSATATFTDCSLTGNGGNGTLSGGAIVSGGTLTLTRCQLTGNSVLDFGSALFLSGPSTVDACAISDNTSLGPSSGAVTSGAVTSLQSLTMTGCSITNNRAHSAAGLTLAGQAVISGTAITGNRATFSVGGGVSSSATLAMAGCSISDNVSVTYGGGLYLTGASTLDDCTVNNNATQDPLAFLPDPRSGGGLFSNGSLTMTRCNVSGNRSQRGGGLALEGQATLDQCSIKANVTPTGNGGGIFSNGSLNMARSLIDGNDSGASGGGLFLGSLATLRHCTIRGNSAFVSNSCGIFSGVGCALLVDHCTIVENHLNGVSGGILQANGGLTTINRSIIIDNGDQDLNEQSSLLFKTESPNIIGTHPAVTGPSPLAVDPLLAPFGDYGGPTATYALLPGSPARNAATGSTATSDQRGFPIVGPADLGAYEAGTLAPNYLAYIYETLPASATAPQHDTTADYDGDGQTNGVEWNFLTNAASSSSFFAPTATTDGINFHITFKSALGRSYALERSDTLAQDSWTNTGLTTIGGDGGQKTFSVPSGSTARRFFRVVPQ